MHVLQLPSLTLTRVSVLLRRPLSRTPRTRSFPWQMLAQLLIWGGSNVPFHGYFHPCFRAVETTKNRSFLAENLVLMTF